MKNWYVVYTQLRGEDRALCHLQNQGFECFLPRLRRRRSHARKTWTVLEPLFPRYLFALFDRATTAWRGINGSRGVVSLLTDGLLPVPVPEDVIKKLLSQTDADGITSPAALQLLSKGVHSTAVRRRFCWPACRSRFNSPGNIRVNLLLSVLGRVARLQVPICAVEPV